MYHQDVGFCRSTSSGLTSDLVGEVVERTSIAVVEVHLQQLADPALVDQALGRHMAFDPPERPVDDQLATSAGHRLHHSARIGHGRGKGLLDKDMEVMGCQPLGEFRVFPGRGAKDGHVIRAGRHAGIEIGEDAILGHSERVDCRLHPGSVRIEYAGDFGVRTFMHHSKQVTHVHVIEADPDDAKLGHSNLLSIACRRS